VVTDNLVFASSSSAVYAIDIATRQAVWSYPRPGMLALSADATLLIATGATASDGGVVAIRLR
jgi:outer membrane protein assembly factor BamB